jgi:RNA polymerase sigma factor (sigma-70 family)
VLFFCAIKQLTALGGQLIDSDESLVGINVNYYSYREAFMPSLNEETLLNLASTGDINSRNELITAYSGFIKNRATKLAEFYKILSKKDIIQMAFEIITEEAAKYDKAKHASFRGFVSFVLATILPAKLKSITEDSDIVEKKGLLSRGRDIDFDQIDFQNAVETALKFLDEKERLVITYRFGLNGQDKWSLPDIGTKLGGLSRFAVRRIERRALQKLRNPWCLRSLAHFYVS